MVKNKGGRPAKTLSPKQLEQVATLAGRGFTIKDIAQMMDMSLPTMIKLGGESFQKGKNDAKNYVVKRLFDLIKEGDKASIFFYLKTQCGWTETQRIETDVNVQHVISAKPIDEKDWAEKWTGKTIDITERGDDEQENQEASEGSS
jgi:hypothetical protein